MGSSGSMMVVWRSVHLGIPFLPRLESTRETTSSVSHSLLITKGQGPKRLVTRRAPVYSTCTAAFDKYEGIFPVTWMGIPSVDSEWVERRLPVLLHFLRTLVTLVCRLSWMQLAAFAEWVPEAGTVTAEASQGVTVDTVSARAEQGAVASTVAASVEQGPERIDPVLRDLDEHLSFAITITDEEQIDQGEKSSLTQMSRSAEGVPPVPPISAATSYAAVLAKDPPQVTQADRPKTDVVLDVHFQLGPYDVREAMVSDMHEIPLPHPPNNPVKLSGGTAVFCDPSSYPRRLFRRLSASGCAAAIGVSPRHGPGWSAAHKEAFEVLIRSPNTKALDEIGLDLTARGVKKQEESLQYLPLGFADSSRSVILHPRERKGKEDEVYFSGLKLVSPCLPWSS
ncbi:hypothetical protein PoB_004077200 [Plakobranchus ocellatus]|uniref:Uncharacterized protein n=1 Tax=Plakobranchus ocellatus TaxID=259542 RepID=A0AAV4B598_9GAST|nr:hypothetical protein PoB_004077200 [Plakobranchus ocellatus]